MHIETYRFGQLEINEEKLITFKDGILGLEDYNEYALLQFEDSYPIVWLQSINNGEICLPVLDTFAVSADYVFDIEDDDVQELELKGPEELHVVNVLVIPENVENMTVNLAAPIIINTIKRKAKQILLSGREYNIRVPIFQDICKVMREEGTADACSVEKAE